MHSLIGFLVGFLIGWMIFESMQKDARPVGNFIRRTWDRWSIKQQIIYERYQAGVEARRQAYFDKHGV